MSLHLREHQQIIVDKVWQNFEQGVNRQLILCPYGSWEDDCSPFFIDGNEREGTKECYVGRQDCPGRPNEYSIK
jgi:hypothetical protein